MENTNTTPNKKYQVSDKELRRRKLLQLVNKMSSIENKLDFIKKYYI